MSAHSHLIKEIRGEALALTDDFFPLIKMIDDARFVLIGEATHGTEEFYQQRAELTKILIAEHGFAAVAVEGDWPDCYRVHRYVQGSDKIHNAHSALSGFLRFPSWMWRNRVMVEFTDWLHDHNLTRMPQEKVGFYGLDLYSLHASIEAVISYLERVDPPAARQARHYYDCFDHYYTENPQEYGLHTLSGLTKTCEDEVVKQLISLRHRAHSYMKRDGFAAGEEFFCAEQNAKVVAHAEEYYRAIFGNRIHSWNLRDKHMADTLNAIAGHLSDRRNESAKVVVWAHNSHIGDARATEMGERGEWNLGQLMREQHGMHDTRLIGFSTYRGEVTAASEWDEPAECKTVLPALPESYEALLHETCMQDFLLILRGNQMLSKHLALNRLQRAIGVLYLPLTERFSHYYFSRLPDQFDALIHIDVTHALKPLETEGLWHQGEMLETYPSGM
jgi:erythromycin esterase-like protein